MAKSQRLTFVRTRPSAPACGRHRLYRVIRVLRPRADPLRELQHAAGADTGTVSGTVFVAPLGWPDTANLWFAPRTPLPGAVVELGLWAGTPASFRDSFPAGPPSDFREPRFTVVATVVADDNAQWHASGLPRKTVFAMRVRGPAKVAVQPAYFGNLFWLYTSPTMDIPIVLRRERRGGT